MTQIRIFDTTLRDGEQSPGVNLNQLEKLEIARQLERLRVDRIEAGFPASSEGDFQAVKAIAETIRDTSVIALARTKQQDIDIAWEALRGAEEPAIHVFLATSPIHMKYKLKMTPEEVIETSVNMVKYAKTKFSTIEWSAEDASRSELPFWRKLLNKSLMQVQRLLTFRILSVIQHPKNMAICFDIFVKMFQISTVRFFHVTVTMT